MGSVLSSSSNKKAAETAAETSTQNNAANVALAREIYGNNQQVLAPFTERGNAAGEQINALLGLSPQQQQPVQQQVQPNALSQFAGQTTPQPAFTAQPTQPIPQGPIPNGGVGAPYGLGDFALIDGVNIGFTNDDLSFRGSDQGIYSGVRPIAPTQEQLSAVEQNAFASIPQFAGGNPFPAAQSVPTPQPNVVQPTTEAEILASGQTPQESAFDTFRNSTGYQFRLGEGLDAVRSAYAGIGGLQSGAAQRAINEYGQNFASNEFGNYMNALSGQQAVGAGTASSLAGVGQNFAGTVINSNNLNSANQMNAQLSSGGNNALGNFAGLIGGGLFQAGL